MRDEENYLPLHILLCMNYSESTIQLFLNYFPESLSAIGTNEQFPFNIAARFDEEENNPYFPMIFEEGIKRKTFIQDSVFGLLTIQKAGNQSDKPTPFDCFFKHLTNGNNILVALNSSSYGWNYIFHEV